MPHPETHTEKAWVTARLDPGSTSAVSDVTGVASFRVRIIAASSGSYTLSLDVEGVAPLKVIVTPSAASVTIQVVFNLNFLL